MFVSTDRSAAPHDPSRSWFVLSPSGFGDIGRALREAPVDIAIVHAGRHAAWSWQQLRQGLLNRGLLRGRTSMLSGFAPWLPWVVETGPLALLDFDDPPVLAPHVMPLARRAVLIFKRELPADRWRLLAPVAGATSPEPVFRDSGRWAGLGLLPPL